MKVSQKQKHLGQSVALGSVLVLASIGIVLLMMLQGSTL